MNQFTNLLAAVALSITTMTIGAHTATGSAQGNLTQVVQSVGGSGNNVRAVRHGDTVTLSGYVADIYAREAMLRAVWSIDGVEKVINLVTHSN